MVPVKKINAYRLSFAQYLGQIWKYRALIRIFVIRDFKVQYAQTFLGFFWAIAQPLVAIFIYSVFFYKILGIQTGTIPYPLFVLPGVLGWFNFTKVINESGSVLINNRDIIRKIEFPKFLLLIAKAIVSLTDVAVTFLLLVVLMIFYGVEFKATILLFPFILMLAQIAGLSVATWLSALTIRFRDFFHIIPYLVSFGICVTPVFYPTTILPQSLEYVLYFNPVAAIIALYRWCILGFGTPSVYYAFSAVPVLILFFTGLKYFIKIEDEIVDYI